MRPYEQKNDAVWQFWKKKSKRKRIELNLFACTRTQRTQYKKTGKKLISVFVLSNKNKKKNEKFVFLLCVKFSFAQIVVVVALFFVSCVGTWDANTCRESLVLLLHFCFVDVRQPFFLSQLFFSVLFATLFVVCCFALVPCLDQIAWPSD